MKTVIALIIAALTAGSAHAWGDREQGVLAGIVGTLIIQHIQRDNHAKQSPPQVVYESRPPVVFYRQLPPVILQDAPQVMCPQGTAGFYILRHDRYGRPFYEFDGCR